MTLYKINKEDLLNIHFHELESIFNDVYGITIKFQFVELLKKFEEAGFVICKKTENEIDRGVVDF